MRSLLAALALLSGVALARVPLGAPVPAELRAGVPGPYFVTLYTRGCADAASLAGHWAALAGAGVPAVAVNPPEGAGAPLPPPPGFRAVGGEVALAAARTLRVRAYPTTLLVDGEHRVRDALEGPLTPERVRASLELLGGGP